MSKNNPFKELHDSIQGNSNLYRIMEESIPLSVQTAYFKLSNKIRAKEYLFEYDLWSSQLFDDNVDDGQKRCVLLMLAASREITAFRLLEKYAEVADGEMVYWTALALLEARVQIESDILGERPVIVASGLGGKENKLRFFVVLAVTDNADFSKYQEEMLERELLFHARKYNCEIEEIRVHQNFATIIALLPIELETPGLLFDAVITECNSFGDFLREDYVLTNVRILPDSEIRRTLSRVNLKSR